MTDQEILADLLTRRYGPPVTWDERFSTDACWMEDGATEVHGWAAAHHFTVFDEGYSAFYSEFYFDAAGTLLHIGAWE